MRGEKKNTVCMVARSGVCQPNRTGFENSGTNENYKIRGCFLWTTFKIYCSCPKTEKEKMNSYTFILTQELNT